MPTSPLPPVRPLSMRNDADASRRSQAHARTVGRSEGAAAHASAGSAWVRLWVLVLGPLVTWYVLGQVAEASPYAAQVQWYGSLALLLVWSPLPVSVPAVLLDHDRDQILPGRAWTERALMMVPLMLFRSPARVEFAASLLSWGVLVYQVLGR